jgi:hypothetical protein
MDRINQTFSNKLATRIATLPVFIRPHLSAILADMLVWVDSVESRITALQKMPSADAIAGLNAGPIVSEDAAAKEHRRAALAARGSCEDCEE